MRKSTIEQAITKVGVCSLASLAVIGILAAFFCMCEIDFSILSGTVIESVFCFILIVLSILVGFCFPASILINCSSIAASLKENRKNVEGQE